MDPRDKPSSDHDDEANIDMTKHQEDVAIDDYVPDTEEEKKLVRKIDLYLLPAIWGMYLLSYMVRTMFVTIPTTPQPPLITERFHMRRFTWKNSG